MSDRLVRFFASYGSYHNNLYNKLIHIVFIPTILSTIQGLLLRSAFPILAPIVTCLLSLGYIYIDAISGILSTCIYGSTLYLMSICPWATGTIGYLHASAWIA